VVRGWGAEGAGALALRRQGGCRGCVGTGYGHSTTGAGSREGRPTAEQCGRQGQGLDIGRQVWVRGRRTAGQSRVGAGSGVRQKSAGEWQGTAGRGRVVSTAGHGGVWAGRDRGMGTAGQGESRAAAWVGRGRVSSKAARVRGTQGADMGRGTALQFRSGAGAVARRAGRRQGKAHVRSEHGRVWQGTAGQGGAR
jgi:hypothetical protein